MHDIWEEIKFIIHAAFFKTSLCTEHSLLSLGALVCKKRSRSTFEIDGENEDEDGTELSAF